MQPEKQESTWIYEAWGWAELHRWQIVLGAVGLLGLIIAGYVYFWYRGHTELRANQALLALSPPDQAEKKNSPGHEAFVKLASEFGSSQTATRALLLAAGELYQAGKYAEARGYFEEVVRRDTSGLLAPLAALGMASCLDAENKLDEAFAAYQQVVAKYPEDPVAGRARLALAALHEARGQPAEALKIYDSLVADRKSGTAGAEASVKREVLLREHPELAAASAPAQLPVITPVGDGAPPASPNPTPPAAPAPGSSSPNGTSGTAPPPVP